jgi:predicted phage terminase large subunit-like protein
MAALQYVEKPSYNALLVRRTYGMLAQPGALMDIMREWLEGKPGVHWDHIDNFITFPSGAQLKFGYYRNENDKDQYQGANYHFIGVDELTQFDERQYTWLMSRNRKAVEDDIPLRMWSTSNPGGRGHEWVKSRFLLDETQGRSFIRARLDDNPHLNFNEYSATLSNLDPFTRQQLLEGDWDAPMEGALFQREWFEMVDDYPHESNKVRYWDLAATASAESDYTAGALVAEKGGIYYLLDMVRDKQRPAGVESLITQTAELDGKDVRIFMEQEPGASGVNTIDHYARNVLKGYAFKGNKTTTKKVSRAAPVSSAAEAGNFKIVNTWNPKKIREFLDEASLFPDGPHDDQVDAMSGAVGMLSMMKKKERRVIPPIIVGADEGRWGGLR